MIICCLGHRTGRSHANCVCPAAARNTDVEVYMSTPMSNERLLRAAPPSPRCRKAAAPSTPSSWKQFPPVVEKTEALSLCPCRSIWRVSIVIASSPQPVSSESCSWQLDGVANDRKSILLRPISLLTSWISEGLTQAQS